MQSVFLCWITRLKYVIIGILAFRNPLAPVYSSIYWEKIAFIVSVCFYIKRYMCLMWLIWSQTCSLGLKSSPWEMKCPQLNGIESVSPVVHWFKSSVMRSITSHYYLMPVQWPTQIELEVLFPCIEENVLDEVKKQHWHQHHNKAQCHMTTWMGK